MRTHAESDKTMTSSDLPGVLIVDDDVTIREALHDLLEDAGHTVVGDAPDGRKALQRLRAAPQRLIVLLDLLMPELDGQQVLETVAADAKLARHHAFVLMTAHTRTLPLPLIAMLKQLDVSVLYKPFDIDALLDAVDRAGKRIGAP
jgi:CheY-like chemotaxis protein